MVLLKYCINTHLRLPHTYKGICLPWFHRKRRTCRQGMSPNNILFLEDLPNTIHHRGCLHTCMDLLLLDFLWKHNLQLEHSHNLHLKRLDLIQSFHTIRYLQFHKNRIPRINKFQFVPQCHLYWRSRRKLCMYLHRLQPDIHHLICNLCHHRHRLQRFLFRLYWRSFLMLCYSDSNLSQHSIFSLMRYSKYYRTSTC